MRTDLGQDRRRRAAPRLWFFLLPMLVLAATLSLAGREKDKLPYGEGLIVNVPFPVGEVEQVVEDIVQNGIIRGTKEYNKDEFVEGAKAASTSRVFPAWNEGGKVFYKVREQAIDPRNFKDGGDVGTLVVRYVVTAQGDKNTVLRIDALFQESFRHTVHQSNGSVESSEYKDIHDHLEAVELMKKENVEAERERQERLERKKHPAPESEVSSSALPKAAPEADPKFGESHPDIPAQEAAPQALEQAEAQPPEAQPPAPGQALPGQTVPGQTLEEHVKELRKQVERLVRAPGAPLKSAPFHTASTLQSLPTGTEILIVISTPYWYGVETHDGQHGWIQRDQLEQP